MTEYIVDANAITKKYGSVTALDEVNIKVKRGEIYGLVGDNGAGKSTFLKIAAGQAFPTSGVINLFGENLPKNLQQQRKRTGTLIESPGFFPNLSVEKNLEYYRIQKGIPGSTITSETLKTVNLYGARKKKCSSSLLCTVF